MTAPLGAQSSTTVDSSGQATIVFGPVPTWESWQITNLAVDTDSADAPSIRVFRGAAGTELVDATESNEATASDTAHQLETGDALTVRWSGATPGSSVTATITGTRTPKAGR